MFPVRITAEILRVLAIFFQGICVEENQVRVLPFRPFHNPFRAEDWRRRACGLHGFIGVKPACTNSASCDAGCRWKNKRVQRIRAHEQGILAVQLTASFPVIDGLAAEPGGVLFHPVVVKELRHSLARAGGTKSGSDRRPSLARHVGAALSTTTG